MEYRCEEMQKLRFAVYDVEDEKLATLYYDDFYGDMGCSLGEVYMSTEEPITSAFWMHVLSQSII